MVVLHICKSLAMLTFIENHQIFQFLFKDVHSIQLIFGVDLVYFIEEALDVLLHLNLPIKLLPLLQLIHDGLRPEFNGHRHLHFHIFYGLILLTNLLLHLQNILGLRLVLLLPKYSLTALLE